MTYTKGTFELVAEMIRKQRSLLPPSERAASTGLLNHLALDFCVAFAQSNSQFNRVKFLSACGMEMSA